MALSWNEIRDRAMRFAKDWSGETSEQASSQTFWNEFFEVFGVSRKSVAVYEKKVQRLGTKAEGRIDVFWPGTLIAEHKSAGGDLDAAFTQATDYFHGLKEVERPRYVVVSDFQRFRLYDLIEDTEIEFALGELPKRVNRFAFIAGYQTQKIREEDPLNRRAVEQLGELHDALKQDGYRGQQLEVFLVRLLFCLFADDTGLFTPKDRFLTLLENNTGEDGTDTGPLLAKLFQVLNTKPDVRQKSLDEDLAGFPYVNGKLFEQRLDMPEFNRAMREQLLECCAINWGAISPAIFGAMFQKIIELDAKDRRRQLGAHYTSEANILKLIGPLFLDELRAEFERVKHNKNTLFEFHKKLRTLTFLDPACGCGNFLVITYRELRRLELDVLRAAAEFGNAIGQVFKAIAVDVDQFYGIEIEEFPSQIAQVALWLTDHQMNLEAGATFGEFFQRLPLTKSADIRRGNALRLDWEAFVPPSKLGYILGNPPFIGGKMQTDAQRDDMDFVTKGVPNAGLLDYVAGWYLKAAQYLSGGKEGFVSRDKKLFEDVQFSEKDKHRHGKAFDDIFVSLDRADDEARKRIRCAFVSTNSISQGEQVGVLWSELLRRGLKIQFAHRTFKWTNEAPGRAAVHCVIVGFGRADATRKRLFEYAEVEGPPHEVVAGNINPYLVDAADALLANRRTPLCAVPAIGIGNKPIDGGNYLFTSEERDAFIADEPQSAKWFKRWLGADEFINGWERWCLWLGDCPPDKLKQMPEVVKRVDAVRNVRLASKSAPTRKLAATPTRFHVENIPTSSFLLVPGVSSENRSYIPIGFMNPETLASNLVLIAPDATPYHFGILTSAMHMAWVRSVCGRLKSDFRYSAGIVYNNFPWPTLATDTHKSAIESAAQAVLDTRAQFPDSSLADLYDPNTMPPALLKAHQALDRSVDAAYLPDGGKRSYAGDAERVAFLFRRYAELTSLLPAGAPDAAKRTLLTVEELVDGINPENVHPEIDGGPDVGREEIE